MLTSSIRSFTLSFFVVLAAAAWQVAPAAQSGDKQDPAKTPPAKTDPTKAAPAKAAPAATAWRGDPYMLTTDALTGEPLGPIEKQVKIDVDGREFRFANQANADKFKADPQKAIAAVDEKMIRDQKPFYPLDTCLVSGEKLDSNAVDIVYLNRLIRLSNKDHVTELRKDPSKYIEKLDQAVIAKQGPKYSAKTCPVSTEALGGEMGPPVDYVVGNRLVRLCCPKCKKQIADDPLKYVHAMDRKSEAPAGEPKKPG